MADNFPVDAKQKKAVTFDPKSPAWRGKLWVRLNTPDGIKLFILWPRVIKVACLMAVAGWLGLAGAAWAFVKYKRGITTASYLDIAFYPLRHRHYRATLSEHAYKMAQKQLEQGAWPQAVTSLRTALANNPANLPARRDLATTFHQIGRADMALTLLEAGLTDGKTDPEFLRLYFRLLVLDKRGAQAWTLGKSLLPAQPDASSLHRELGLMLVNLGIDLGHYTESQALLTQWKLDASAEGQHALARIENASGHRAEAIRRLELWLRLHPDDERTGLLLVQLYRAADRLDEARRLALNRVMRHPDSPGARVDLISLYHQSGEIGAYQRERDEFLQRFGHDERALLLLATTASQINDPSLARLILATAPVDADGRKNVRLLLSCMQAECSAGAFAAALELGQQLEGHPALDAGGQAGLYALRTWANYSLNQTTQAQTSLNQLFTLSGPAFTINASALAAKLSHLGLKTETRRLRQALVERNPGDASYLTALISDDLEQQSWDSIRSHLPALLNLDPKPIELLTRIWLARDLLNLPPDLLQRLQTAGGM